MESGNSEEVDKTDLEAAIAEAEALTEEQKEAVADALAAAKAVAEDEEATQEDVDAAAEALNEAIAEATKEPEVPAEDKIAVAKVEADNATTVTVTLKEDLPEDTDLEGATITLTDAEGNTIEATIKEDTNAEGKEFTFVLPEGKELVDTKEYTVTSELFADSTFEAQFGPQVIKEIIANTTKIAENSLKVELDTKNQYGEDEVSKDATLRIKEGTAKLNEMPLTADEIKVEGNTVKLISKSKDGSEGDNKSSVTFKEGDKVEFVVEATYKAGNDAKPEVTATSEKFEYTIQAEEELAPDKIAALTATATDENDESVTVKQGDKVEPKSTVTLTADVRDQFNNKVTDADIRWVVTEGIELLGEETQKITVNKTQQLEVKALLPGKVTVEAYNIANGEKQTFSFEIDKTQIEELTWTVKDEDEDKGLTVVNKEETKLGKLTVNEGADFSAEQVEFKVEALDEDGNSVVVSEDDVKVVAVDEKDEDGEGAEDAKTEVVVKVTTNKPGNYKITPIVKGTEIKAEPKKVTSKVKSNIASIEIDYTAKADGEKVEKGLEIPVVFKNIHEEEIELTNEQLKDVTIASSNKDIKPTLEEVKVKGKDDQLEETGKYVLKFAPQVKGEDGKLTGVQAGKTIVTLQSGNAISKPIEVTFVEAELTAIKVADEKLEGLIANDKEAVYTDLTFFDQHNEEMNATEELEFNVKLGEEEVKDVKAEVVEVYTDAEGNIKEVGTDKEVPEGTKTRKAVKVTAEGQDIKKGDYTVEVSVKENDKVKPVTFTVEVKEAREVKDIKAEPKSSTVALGSPVTVDVTVTDQYGEAFNLPQGKEITAQLIDLETEKEVESGIKVTKVDGDDAKGKYTTTFTPDKGQYELVFTYKKTVDDEVVTATDKVTIHVDEAIDLIDSITFEDVKVGERVVIKDGQSLYDVKKDDTFTLVPKAIDKDGKPVQLQASQLDWKSDNEKLIKVENGVVTVVGTIGDDEEDQKVTVTATLFDVKQEITFNVSGKAPKALPETIAMTVPTGEDNQPLEVTEVTLDETATDGSIEVTYTAVDQYGEDFNINLDKIDSSRTSVATAVKSENNKVKITAVDAGETTIRTTIDGNQVDLKVIVTKEAAEAAKKAAAQAAADKADVEKAKGQVQDTYEVPFEADNKLEALTNLVKESVTVNGVNVTVAEKTTEEATHTVTLTKGDAKATKDITMTVAEKLPTGVSASGNLTNSGKNSVEEEAGTEATYTYTVSGQELKAGTLNVKVGDESEAKEVTIEANESGQVTAEKVATAIAEAINPVGDDANYTVEADGAKIVFKAKEVGVNAEFSVKLEVAEKADGEDDQKVGATLSNGVLAKGTDKVEKVDAEAAVYELTVTNGATNAGTLEVKAGDAVLGKVEVTADQDVNAVAQAIAEALSNNKQFEVKAEEAKVTFTAKEKKEQSDLTITVADKKEETPAGE